MSERRRRKKKSDSLWAAIDIGLPKKRRRCELSWDPLLPFSPLTPSALAAQGQTIAGKPALADQGGEAVVMVTVVQPPMPTKFLSLHQRPRMISILTVMLRMRPPPRSLPPLPTMLLVMPWSTAVAAATAAVVTQVVMAVVVTAAPTTTVREAAAKRRGKKWKRGAIIIKMVMFQTQRRQNLPPPQPQHPLSDNEEKAENTVVGRLLSEMVPNETTAPPW